LKRKKFNSALRHYKIIHNSFLEIKEKLSEIKGIGIGWYSKHSYRDIDYGTLPIQITPSRKHPEYAKGFSLDDIKNRKFKKVINIVKSRLEDLILKS